MGQIRSEATQPLRAKLARSKGFGASPNKQIFYVLAVRQNIKNSLCGHRGIACRFVRDLKKPLKEYNKTLWATV